MGSILNDKISVLSLKTINKKVYNKYLKPYEESCKKAGINVNQFKYYKLYGQKPMLYSKEYLERTSIIELLERDRENQQRRIKVDESI